MLALLEKATNQGPSCRRRRVGRVGARLVVVLLLVFLNEQEVDNGQGHYRRDHHLRVGHVF